MLIIMSWSSSCFGYRCPQVICHHVLEPVQEHFLDLRYQPNEIFVIFGVKKWAVQECDNVHEISTVWRLLFAIETRNSRPFFGFAPTTFKSLGQT
jgi:hypothetical protein